MRKLITGLILSLFSAFTLLAQYTHVDSPVLMAGSEIPSTFDSSRFVSMGAENQAGQFLPQQRLCAEQIFGEFYLPSHGKVISPFGLRHGRVHSGTDIKMSRGDTVFAAFFGTVSRARYFYGYGNMVVVEHEDRLETSYAHLSAFLVKPGEFVERGQPLGLAGSTGRATTNHLHFEMREAGKPFNPELVFDFENGKVRNEARYANNLTELQRGLETAGYPVNEHAPRQYTVKNGDSLWKISRRYRTSVNTLCVLNNLTENSVLQVGMVLKVY